jgi:hypothetical protein
MPVVPWSRLLIAALAVALVALVAALASGEVKVVHVSEDRQHTTTFP